MHLVVSRAPHHQSGAIEPPLLGGFFERKREISNADDVIDQNDVSEQSAEMAGGEALISATRFLALRDVAAVGLRAVRLPLVKKVLVLNRSACWTGDARHTRAAFQRYAGNVSDSLHALQQLNSLV